MANSVSMTTQQAIQALHQRGYSKRKISRELGIHRQTVDRYLGQSTQAAPSSGSIPPDDPKCTTPSPGSGPAGSPPQPSPGSVKSACEPFRETIEKKLAQGLHAKRIWQDLVDEQHFGFAYASVKRFVARLKAADPDAQKPVWRMECEPGEEAQIDYGTTTLTLAGKRRKIHFLRVTLSHSRKGYTEAMPRQDTESFIRGLENALRHFGGVPRTLILDNLKAGVLKPDLYDPELNPKFASFCRHYGLIALPAKPYTPQHKGKVESNIRYIRESALKAKTFPDLHAVNVHLRHWEKTTADTRIHGTTRRQVGAHFTDIEQPALQPLPDDLFPSFSEGQRSVHRDSYAEWQKAYYHIPAEHIGHRIWIRDDGRMIQAFNHRMEAIALHPKLEAGKFSKVLGAGGTPVNIRQSLTYWAGRSAELGPDAALWARDLIRARREAALRPLMGLNNQLPKNHTRAQINHACAQARLHNHHRLRDLRHHLENPGEQQNHFDFLTDHPVIRDLHTYGQIASFEPKTDPSNPT